MTKQKIKMKQNSKKPDENKEMWKLHDIYAEGACYGRVLTRSQMAFVRIKNTESDTELFAVNMKHDPPGMPHLMTTLKGLYGAVPRTKITRRFAQNVSVSETLCTAIDKYKTATVIDVKGNEEIKQGRVGKDETEEKVDEESKKEEELKGQVEDSEEKQESVAKRDNEDSEEKQKEEKASGSWVRPFW